MECCSFHWSDHIQLPLRKSESFFTSISSGGPKRSSLCPCDFSWNCLFECDTQRVLPTNVLVLSYYTVILTTTACHWSNTALSPRPHCGMFLFLIRVSPIIHYSEKPSVLLMTICSQKSSWWLGGGGSFLPCLNGPNIELCPQWICASELLIMQICLTPPHSPFSVIHLSLPMCNFHLMHVKEI